LRDNNWIIWLIVLGFGWSIAAGIASVMVSQLGFPYTWIMPLTLVMIGTVAILAYRGYPVQAWLLAGCVGFVLVSGMAIAHALIVPEPNIPDAYRAEFEANDRDSSFMGFDIPYYGDYGSDYTIEYNATQRNYLVQPGVDARTPITVEFPTIESAGGQWAFVSGSMRLRGGISAQVEADPGDNWLNANESVFTSGETLHSARPQLTVSIPLPSHPTRAPTDATATLTIAYPLADGSVEQKTLTRDFTLTIIGSDYYYYYSKYRDWERARSVIETPLWLVLVVGSVFAGAGSVYFIREGALVPQATGGLQMVIRRLSGFQKLGTDVHPIERFRDQTGVDQGVFVGRVIAQSPAGRAGFRTGDVLIELDGKPTNSPSAVNRIAKGHNKGDIVPAVVLRDGVRVDLRVRF
jgi:hypothetical protein